MYYYSSKETPEVIEVDEAKFISCRRLFCANEFLAGTPVELIMKISGHKSLRDFYKYIRISPEEAGQRIRELWERRGDM